MELETVVYPPDLFSYIYKELCSLGSGSQLNWGYNELVQKVQHKGVDQHKIENWDPSSNTCDPNSSQEETFTVQVEVPLANSSDRRKRRRTKSTKNKEEMESQRMTHIAVERNRRKQMNEYLTVIRSLMPASYVQRGDQASIIGGAINFVKELEQLLQTLEAQKRTSATNTTASTSASHQPNDGGDNGGSSSQLFADFFTFPQYSTSSARSSSSSTSTTDSPNEPSLVNRSALADIEVNMVETHANLKILSKRRPRQLLKLVAGLQCLRLTLLHLNVTTVDDRVLYSISMKVEDGCQMSTVDEIADGVNQLLARIEEEACFS